MRQDFWLLSSGFLWERVTQTNSCCSREKWCSRAFAITAMFSWRNRLSLEIEINTVANTREHSPSQRCFSKRLGTGSGMIPIPSGVLIKTMSREHGLLCVRALASHQCGLGSIPARCHMWVEFVVGSHPCFEGFSPGSLVFLPPQKSTSPNSNSTGIKDPLTWLPV